MISGGNNFPGLSRTKMIFQDFPGPGILKKKNPGLSRRHGNRVKSGIYNPNNRASFLTSQFTTYFFLSSRSVTYGHVFDSSSFFSISKTVSVFTC